MDKIIQLAKKLKALSDKGVGGEKINAEKMLQKIMEKHNLTIEDVEGEKKDFAYYKVNQKQQEIFWQVVSSVIGKHTSYTDKRKRGYFLLKVTASEAVEIQMKYDFFWKLYQEEFDIWRSAFIARNDIYHPDGNKIDMADLSGEELQKIKRIAEMSQSIKRGELRKQIHS